MPQSLRQRSSFTTLRQFTRTPAPTERCQFCGAALAADHAHLFEPAQRQLACACAACLVSVGEQAGTLYRRVPQQIRYLPDFRLTDAQWDSLLIPVGMAFFFYNSPAARMMTFYPSPAGATESLLDSEAWAEIVHDNPLLQTQEQDVEALLVNRLNPALAHGSAGVQEYLSGPD